MEALCLRISIRAARHLLNRVRFLRCAAAPFERTEIQFAFSCNVSPAKQFLLS
jgi:hypothetical protein